MPSVMVKPGAFEELEKLNLTPDALRPLYHWLTRTMFRAPYLHARVDFDDDQNFVGHDIEWEPIRTDWDKKRRAYYKYKLQGHFKDVSGQWAILNSDGSVEVYQTFGAAHNGKHGEWLDGQQGMS